MEENNDGDLDERIGRNEKGEVSLTSKLIDKLRYNFYSSFVCNIGNVIMGIGLLGGSYSLSNYKSMDKGDLLPPLLLIGGGYAVRQIAKGIETVENYHKEVLKNK